MALFSIGRVEPSIVGGGVAYGIPIRVSQIPSIQYHSGRFIRQEEIQMTLKGHS